MLLLEDIARRAKEASRTLSVTTTGQRRDALLRMAEALVADAPHILAQNTLDIAKAHVDGRSAAFIDRLTLSGERIEDMAAGLLATAALPDPLNIQQGGWSRPNGLEIRRVSVPLGVIGIIYESRPNVTADAAALCVYAGNACVLRGGSDALKSNMAIMEALRRGLEDAGLPRDCAALLEDTSRQTARAMMRLNGLIDVLIPRGGAELIRTVVEQATVPVIETGTGNCHVYVDRDADLDMARSIAVSAKTSRPSVCNAAETLLVHRDVADAFLPGCLEALFEAGVRVRGCPRVAAYSDGVEPASAEDWDAEYLNLIYAVKVVDSLGEAIEHIGAHGTRHSEAIITGSLEASRAFTARVDAACVYVNASTRFTDGAEFGFGAEIGISNQKLHARGPMGLSEITTYKYIVQGQGQVR